MKGDAGGGGIILAIAYRGRCRGERGGRVDGRLQCGDLGVQFGAQLGVQFGAQFGVQLGVQFGAKRVARSRWWVVDRGLESGHLPLQLSCKGLLPNEGLSFKGLPS